MGAEKPKKVTTSRVFAASTILAVVISVPAIVVTLVLHYLVKTNLMITMVAGLVTLFLAMGFAYKLSKKLAAKVQDDASEQAK